MHPSACTLNVTLWNDPLIGRRVTWPSKDGLPGLAFAVRGAFPELCSCDISFFLLPARGRWEADRVRIVDDSGLVAAAQLIRAAFSSAPMSKDYPTFYVYNDGKAPTASPGHNRGPSTSASPPASSTSSGGSTSRRPRQRQSIMRKGVLLRDGQQCLFCGHGVLAHLHCAHIIAYARHIESDVLEACDLIDVFDIINGLTLCIECHAAFDAGLICIDAVTKRLVLAGSATLAEYLHMRGNWHNLQNHPLRKCNGRFLAYWPTSKLFAYQQENFERMEQSRGATTKSLHLPVPPVATQGARSRASAAAVSVALGTRVSRSATCSPTRSLLGAARQGAGSAVTASFKSATAQAQHSRALRGRGALFVADERPPSPLLLPPGSSDSSCADRATLRLPRSKKHEAVPPVPPSIYPAAGTQLQAGWRGPGGRSGSAAWNFRHCIDHLATSANVPETTTPRQLSDGWPADIGMAFHRDVSRPSASRRMDAAAVVQARHESAGAVALVEEREVHGSMTVRGGSKPGVKAHQGA